MFDTEELFQAKDGFDGGMPGGYLRYDRIKGIRKEAIGGNYYGR